MKILKLLLLALAVVGGVLALLLIPRQTDDSNPLTDLESATAYEWKSEIDSLCKYPSWTGEGYDKIYSGVHSDYEIGDGDLISADEKDALHRYLFSSSCKMLFNFTDSLFRQSVYTDSAVAFAKTTCEHLEASSYTANSNLSEAAALIKEYNSILGLVLWNRAAKYTTPLNGFNAPEVDDILGSIRGKKHFSSHFSNNEFIVEKMSDLPDDLPRREAEYYMKLAKAIVAHYSPFDKEDLESLLKDQIDFSRISTNAAADSYLSDFIYNLSY